MIKFDRRKFVGLCAAGAALSELPRNAQASGLLGRKDLGLTTAAERYPGSVAPLARIIHEPAANFNSAI